MALKYGKRSDPNYFTRWVADRNQRRRRHLDAYKLRKGCANCGYKEHVIALQWDHIDPLADRNAKRIGHSIKHHSLKRLFQNLRQCQVLCANCHAVKTKQEGGFNGTSSH